MCSAHICLWTQTLDQFSYLTSYVKPFPTMYLLGVGGGRRGTSGALV